MQADAIGPGTGQVGSRVTGNVAGRDTRTDGRDGPVVTPGASPLRLRLRAYARMGRTIRYENWLGTPLWWSLLPAGIAGEARTLLLVPLTLLAYMSMVAVMGTLDDVQGERDGSDMANYRRSDPTGLRPMTRKPLLLGWVTPRQARRYAAVAGGVCVAVTVGASLVGTGEPAWWLPAYAVMAAVGAQYSAGLRLSYIGAQELTLFTVKVGSVTLPYALVTGELPAGVVVAGVLMALWFVQVSMCSNTHDREGDGAAGRRTMAVLLSEGGHRRVIAAVVAAGWAAIATAAVAGWWSPWLVVGAVPAGALHARLLGALFRGDPLRGRAAGFLALRTGVAGLCLASLLVR